MDKEKARDSRLNGEVIKLRKVLNSGVFSEDQKKAAWISMLTLQWVRSADHSLITPLDICGIHGPSFKNYLKGKAKK